ncbi:MAG: M67 family metallopeptidase [Mariprofundaceae bacterium]|nr:M67 family metallopeptidase [Mariprofundaceae bacterium]
MPLSEYEPARFRSPEYMAVWSEHIAEQACSITADAIENMKSIAVLGYPNEVCGLLLGHINQQGWCVSSVRQLANLNTDRAADRFQLDPKGYQAVDVEIRNSDVEIIGVFHSHPDCPAKPSPTDLDGAWEGFLYPIVSVCDGEVRDVRYWEPHDDTQQFHPVFVQEKNV